MNPLHTRMFVPSLVKIVPKVLDSKFFYFVNVFVTSHFRDAKYLCTGFLLYTLIRQCTPSVGIFQIQGRELMHKTSQLRFPGPGGGSPGLTGHQLCPYKKLKSSCQSIYIIYLNISQLSKLILYQSN